MLAPTEGTFYYPAEQIKPVAQLLIDTVPTTDRILFFAQQTEWQLVAECQLARAESLGIELPSEVVAALAALDPPWLVAPQALAVA
jgi:hypothetical protein